jgi:Uri superfamily endonuclease
MRSYLASVFDTLPVKGNYTLIIALNTPIRIRAAKHDWRFHKGYYAYTGSAMGNNATNLRQRVARHVGKIKKQHWHIDYFLSSRKARITTIVAAASDVNNECEITRRIQRIQGAIVPIAKFGASDCQRNCMSHLVYFKDNVKLKAIADVYRHTLGSAQILQIQPVPTEL